MWTLQRSPAVIRDDYGPRSLTLHRMSREEIDEDKRFEKYAVSLKADMVSRRKILSRSRDDLNLDPYPVEEEEDVWQQKDKLYKDHIQEILDKWNSIDDEIWAKVIVMERNRRVAKAYARAPVLTVNGSDDGFDGFRIGLCGFDNPMRDAKGEEVKRHIGNGVKVKMDDAGNILIKRISKTNVYVKNTVEENSVSNDILKLPNGALEMEKPVKLFDMKKFQQNVSRELKRAYPDRRKLETQCICSVAFVKNETEVLECPIWVMFINVVAMDMLKSKMPPVAAPGKRSADIRNRPRIPIPDEDPYSIAGSGSSGSSGNGNNTSNTSGNKRTDKPPKLPPRDNGIYGQNIPKPDYDEVMDENGFKAFQSSRTSKDSKNDKKYDDPYYCGLRARIPNFAKSKGKDKEEKNNRHVNNGTAAITGPLPHPHYGQPMMWHSRSFDSGMASMGGNGVSENHRLWNPTTWVPQSHAYLPAHHDSDFTESAYSRIYGRLPIPRSYVPIAPTRVYHGEWN